MVATRLVAEVTDHMTAILERSGLPALTRHAWVEVDLDALVANARALANLAAPAALGVIVKADGYGHGLEMAARAAVAGGATWLCVADAAEAFRLRADGYEGPVFVVYPVPTALLGDLAQAAVDVTVGSSTQASTLAHTDLGAPLRVHLEIDTGMTRGGALPAEAPSIARTIAEGSSTTLGGVWTHLAAPEDPEFTATQMRRFDETVAAIRSAGIEPGAIHAAASGGLLTLDVSSHSLVRPGLAFYGSDPDVGHQMPSEVGPAIAVKAHPVRVVSVAPGTRVGYAGTWEAPRPSVIATLPIGYADGWSRSSAGSEVLVEGQRVSVVGRISSDSLAVDVTEVPGVDVDTEFTLLGDSEEETIDADEVARRRGTISWEVLQQLGARLTRVYRSGGVPVAVRAESSIDVDIAGEVPGY